MLINIYSFLSTHFAVDSMVCFFGETLSRVTCQMSLFRKVRIASVVSNYIQKNKFFL